jgi:hypothetical protein
MNTEKVEIVRLKAGDYVKASREWYLLTGPATVRKEVTGEWNAPAINRNGQADVAVGYGSTVEAAAGGVPATFTPGSLRRRAAAAVAEAQELRKLAIRLNHLADEQAAKKTNKAATKHVFRNLQRDLSMWNLVGESFPMDSMESYRDAAKRWLGDKSELSTTTIEEADWTEVYEYFRGETQS